ncbi:MAG: bifunctional oligoribonuclease/PAP phosphatase NrnA [Fimbriimonadaceae bacterium]|nr:bifunctional oligoribonuclease/PAP phosphatase NrnA [Fimbriimonadaceae bacterium]
MSEHTLTPEQVAARRAEFEDYLRKANGVLIGTHVQPDGDAIGSSLAVSLWLSKLGIESQVLCHHPAPPYLEFLPAIERLRQAPSLEADTGILVDLESMSRLGSLGPLFEAMPRLVLVDHHLPHERPGDLRIVATNAPATASVLMDLMEAAEPGLDADIATCLATGLVTDTGSFRFPNTTPHALHQTARLVELGADLSKISQEVYLNKDDAAVRLLGLVLARIRTAAEGRLAWATIPHETFETAQAEEFHTEGIVNEILSMRSARAAFLLREARPGKIRASLRSKGAVDVAQIAQRFGGGGHKLAAGASFEGSLEAAEAALSEAFLECLES